MSQLRSSVIAISVPAVWLTQAAINCTFTARARAHRSSSSKLPREACPPHGRGFSPRSRSSLGCAATIALASDGAKREMAAISRRACPKNCVSCSIAPMRSVRSFWSDTKRAPCSPDCTRRASRRTRRRSSSSTIRRLNRHSSGPTFVADVAVAGAHRSPATLQQASPAREGTARRCRRRDAARSSIDPITSRGRRRSCHGFRSSKPRLAAFLFHRTSL